MINNGDKEMSQDLTNEQQDIINSELKKTVQALSLNPKLQGVALQLAYHKPNTADGFVSSLFVGCSAKDTKLAVEQLQCEQSISLSNIFSTKE
jgi:hypothetical protein